jgi:hypothetical protein
VLLFGVVSLKVGSTTGLLMSSGHGGDQATAAKEYYTTPPPYYATKSTYATSTYNTEPPPSSAHHQCSRVTIQITLSRVTSPKRLSTTSPRHCNWGGEVLRSPGLQHCSCSFILRWTETTPRQQLTTPQPTLHLATMTKPQTTTQKRSHVAHQRTVPQFTTPRNPSITLLQATTKLMLLFATPRPPSITLQPNGKYCFYMEFCITLFFFSLC